MNDYMITVDENGSPSLAHYGVLGMKWGVRHDPKKAYAKSVKKAKKYQKKIDKHTAKAAKQLSKGAKKSSRFLFRDTQGAKKNYNKSKVQSAKAVRQAERGSKWIKRMEKEFAKQNVVSIDKSILDLGTSYTNRVMNMTDELYLRSIS